MQPYERIGLVTVMFLVVLLAVGFFWKDGSSDSVALAAETESVVRIDEEAQARAVAAQAKEDRLRAARAHLAEKGESRRGTARSLNMGGQDELESQVNRVTTASAGSDHRSAPLGLEEKLAAPARAQSADKLANFARPSNGRTRRTLAQEVSMNQRSERRRSAEAAPASREPRRVAAAAPAERESRRDPVAFAPEVATYTVRSGDVLQRIALKELGDASRTAEIASLNGLSNPDMIRIGMVLTLPAKISPSKTAAAASSPSAGSGAASGSSSSGPVGATYKIKKGESLSRALTRELGTYKRSIRLVQALNPGLNPDRVRAGQVIKLPRLEDIPTESGGKSKAKASSRGGAPALDASPQSSQVASAERPGSPGSGSPGSNDEFVVR